MEYANNTPQRLRRWIDNLLNNTHNHYPSFLPGAIGFPATLMLRLFFRRIQIDKDSLDRLQTLRKEGILVYAAKHKSVFEFLCSHIRYQQENAPFPKIGFDYKIWLWQPVSRIFKILLAAIDHFFLHGKKPNPYTSGFFKQELLAGKTGFVSMVQEGGFYRQFVKDETDPVMHLIQMQQETDRPVFIVPQILFFTRKPMMATPSMTDALFGTVENPGGFRRAYRLCFSEERPFIETSEPLNLQEFLARPENQGRPIQMLAFDLRSEITARITRHRQSIQGPALKSLPEIKEAVLRNERLHAFFTEQAARKNMRVQAVYKKADKHLDEIAAVFNMKILASLAMAVRFISRTMFDGVDMNPEDIKKFKATAQKGPVLLMPSHKSHIDYLILSYILYSNGLPVPLIAAGQNLSFWPLGPIFRGSGAFFLRRTFKGNLLYARVFAEYVKAVLAEGYNIEFFIEGGRSRTGKLILPRYGLLSIILNAYKEGACKDLYFLPVFIGYDRVVEEGSYIHELEGGEKESENLSQVVKARRFLKKRYGRIYLRFSEPFRLADVLDTFETPLARMDQKEQGVVCRNLGHRVINAIQESSVVTPHALVAASILAAFRKSFSGSEAVAAARVLAKYLESKEAALSVTMQGFEAGCMQALDRYVRDKFLLRQESGSGENTGEADSRYIIVENKRPMLEYYKNNCVSFFVPEAYCALSILALNTLQFSARDIYETYEFLQDLLKNEFHYKAGMTVEQYVRKGLKAYIDNEVITPHSSLPETYCLTAQGIKTLRFFAAFLRPCLEAYLVVLAMLALPDAAGMNKKERGKRTIALARKMAKLGEIDLKESVSQVYFQNAEEYFLTRGLPGPESQGAQERYTKAVREYLRLMA
jgi:glycerol-3-phosphate O-acyltransferase